MCHTAARRRFEENLKERDVMDMSQEMPAESQWDLLEKYGLNDGFSAACIDTEHIGEITGRLRADPSSGIVCDIDTAFVLPARALAWIGARLPGWSVAVALSGILSFCQEEASVGGRRIITH
jgi:hypothetical protein